VPSLERPQVVEKTQKCVSNLRIATTRVFRYSVTERQL
jgi:hypothetical protein